MPEATVSIARVPLARATRRLIAAPIAAVALGGVTVGVALLAGGVGGIALALAGVVTLVLGAWLGVILLTIRLDVEVSSIRLAWLGGERRYTLVRGPVTRVALDGAQAVSLRARFGAFGWILGRATLRGEERIEIVRLARTSSLILVPTEGMRLAIAPRSERDLIAALTAAARVQQRLDAARPRVTLPVAPIPAERIVPVAPPPSMESMEPTPRVLTGIERVELEERLAAQRAAALASAEAERRSLEDARAAAALAPAVAARPGRTERRVPRLERPAWTRPSRRILAPLALLFVPLIAAAVAWVFAVIGGQDRSASVQNLVLALVLAGPGATLAAIGVRLWRPRLVPLVIGTSLFALVLVGGALVAPH